MQNIIKRKDINDKVFTIVLSDLILSDAEYYQTRGHKCQSIDMFSMFLLLLI